MNLHTSLLSDPDLATHARCTTATFHCLQASGALYVPRRDHTISAQVLSGVLRTRRNNVLERCSGKTTSNIQKSLEASRKGVFFRAAALPGNVGGASSSSAVCTRQGHTAIIWYLLVYDCTCVTDI